MSAFAKIVQIVCALLFIVAGISAFCMPSATLSGIAIFLGIMLIITGIGYVISYFYEKKSMLGANWVLVAGISTILIGIFVLCNETLVASALPIMLAIWILIIGIIRVMSSLDLRRLHFEKWWVSTIVGAGLIILSVLSFFQPIISTVLITTFVGLYLVINGIYSLVELYYITKLEKVAEDYLKKMDSIVVEPIEVRTEDDK